MTVTTVCCEQVRQHLMTSYQSREFGARGIVQTRCGKIKNLIGLRQTRDSKIEEMLVQFKIPSDDSSQRQRHDKMIPSLTIIGALEISEASLDTYTSIRASGTFISRTPANFLREPYLCVVT